VNGVGALVRHIEEGIRMGLPQACPGDAGPRKEHIMSLYRPLTTEEIDTALASLEGWRRDDDALVRRVEVPADGYPGLREAVANEAKVLEHQAEMRQDGDDVEIRLQTHDAGGVTAKDVELAARIDQVLSGAARDRAS
jgi:4a-hydroxytetrahydrobiopterin dehydratase